MEDELHQRHPLHVAALDVMDAVDVEEVILVVVGEQTFHLRRVHATVRLTDIDDRQVEARKDIDLHPLHGQHGAHRQRDKQHHDGDGAAEGERDGIHRGDGCTGEREQRARGLFHPNP
jgi:hypothetical protein